MQRGSAKFYGVFYNGSTEAVRRAEFVDALLGGRPAQVIDVSAGVGDMAFELARRGHQVLGFEPCGEIYTVLFDRYARERELRHLLALFPSRLEDYTLEPHADLVLASNHWSHLEPSERLPLLRRVYAALRGGGKLLMNCAQPTSLRADQPWSEIQKRIFGELVIKHFASSTALPDRAAHEIRFEYRMEQRGVHVHTETSQYLLHTDTPEGVTALLAEAGFAAPRVLGDYAEVDYDANHPGFVVVAQKPFDAGAPA